VTGAESTPRLQTTLLLGFVPQTVIGSPTASGTHAAQCAVRAIYVRAPNITARQRN
jgi:hypothetical protein